MAYPPPVSLTSWSFSRLKDYRCPLRAKLKHILKLKEPSTPALERGTAIHTAAEHYIKGLNSAKVPAELAAFSDYFKARRKQFAKNPDQIFVEQSWAYRNDWSITRFDDWNGCWLRVKVDVAWTDPKAEPGVLYIDDVKTGKYRPDDNEDYLLQLDLYALSAFIKYDWVEVARPRLLYVDHGILYPSSEPIVYTRAQVPAMKAAWEKRVKPLLADKKFAPKPSNECRWCAFSAARGGQCKF